MNRRDISDSGHSGDEIIVVFGASGTLGTAIVQRVAALAPVVPVTRGFSHELPSGWLSSESPGWTDQLPEGGVAGVVWAGGANCSNSLSDGSQPFRTMLEANLLYVTDTLAMLLSCGRLADGCSLVILSSVWQDLARNAKSAYIVSKAAVGGLVRAAAVDLGARGIRVNAVLPGVVDTPMTRASLGPEQIAGVARSTPLGRLVTPDEVAASVAWLLGPDSSGLTGTSIPVDGGWGHSHAL